MNKWLAMFLFVDYFSLLSYSNKRIAIKSLYNHNKTEKITLPENPENFETAYTLRQTSLLYKNKY